MTKTEMDTDELVENEWYAVRYSGEIPEIAYHSAIHYLTRDADGPRVELTDRQDGYLVDAVKQRYLDIILRDLLPINKHTGAYRGVLRSLINWKRFELFCRKHRVAAEPFKPVVAQTLTDFLEYELKNDGGETGERLNCSWAELLDYACLLGLDSVYLPAGSRALCLVREDDETAPS